MRPETPSVCVCGVQLRDKKNERIEAGRLLGRKFGAKKSTSRPSIVISTHTPPRPPPPTHIKTTGRAWNFRVPV